MLEETLNRPDFVEGGSEKGGDLDVSMEPRSEVKKARPGILKWKDCKKASPMGRK